MPKYNVQEEGPDLKKHVRLYILYIGVLNLLPPPSTPFHAMLGRTSGAAQDRWQQRVMKHPKLSSVNSREKSVLAPVNRKEAGPAWKGSKSLGLSKREVQFCRKVFWSTGKLVSQPHSSPLSKREVPLNPPSFPTPGS